MALFLSKKVPPRLKVAVCIDLKIPLSQNDKAYFARNFTEPTERALAWVLWALFAHSPDIGLKLKGEYPAFW